MPRSPRPLEIICRSALRALPVKKLHRTARFLYKREKVLLSRRVSLVFCSDREIRRLNKRYRGTDRATDVLSFFFGDDDLLGEIYICSRRAAAQAKRYGLSNEHEILRLFIHGFYHLMGYEHKTSAGFKKMEKKEAYAFSKIIDQDLPRLV